MHCLFSQNFKNCKRKSNNYNGNSLNIYTPLNDGHAADHIYKLRMHITYVQYTKLHASQWQKNVPRQRTRRPSTTWLWKPLEHRHREDVASVSLLSGHGLQLELPASDLYVCVGQPKHQSTSTPHLTPRSDAAVTRLRKLKQWQLVRRLRMINFKENIRSCRGTHKTD